MFCSKCGRNNPDTASFCTGCGAPMQKNFEKTEVPNVPKPHIEPVVNSDPKVVSQSLSEANAALGNKNLSKKPKKSKKKKAIIITSVILSLLLVAGAVGLAIYLHETANMRHWDNAILSRDCNMIIDAYNESIEEDDGDSYRANLWMCKVIRNAAQCVNNEFSEFYYDDGNADVVNQVKALLNEQFGDLFYSKNSYGSYGYDDGIIFGMESFCDEDIPGGVTVFGVENSYQINGTGQDYLNKLVSLIESKAAYYNGLSYWNNEEYDKAIAEFLKVIPDDTLYEDAVEKTRTENSAEAESKGQASSSNEPKEPAKPGKDFTADMTAEQFAMELTELIFYEKYDEAKKYFLFEDIVNSYPLEEGMEVLSDVLERSECSDRIKEGTNYKVTFEYYDTNSSDNPENLKQEQETLKQSIINNEYAEFGLYNLNYDSINFSKITEAYFVDISVAVEFDDGYEDGGDAMLYVVKYGDSWRCLFAMIDM